MKKRDIAIGMGVPLSKLDSSASTDSNRDADDVQFIEDTVLPEINWIYDVVNTQVFEPMGYRIVAQPQALRVMQANELERAQAFANYSGEKMSIEAALSQLGIVIPGVEIPETIDLRPMQIAAPEPMPEPEPEPEPMPEPMPQRTLPAPVDILAQAEKIEEVQAFKRWLKKRNEFNLSDFKTALLSDEEKLDIARKVVGGDRINDEIPPIGDEGIEPDDPAINEAIRRFNRIFPNEKELLTAAVVENA
jgi:hypothetical protein